MKPKIQAPTTEIIQKTLKIINKYNVNTVCFSAKCPNLTECFSRGIATFMLMGKICSRNCRFCNVTSGIPLTLDENEPQQVAKAIQSLGLNYVVLTSVDRDDLVDFGSSHFLKTIIEIDKLNQNIQIEVLTPDFQGDINSLNLLVTSTVYKLAHNIETVKRVHKKLKPKSDYNLSLKVLEYYSKFKITKSSIILGFGETKNEIIHTFRDLINVGVSEITISQYLRPSSHHYEIKKYYNDNEFLELKNIALNMGFKSVESGNLVRSSYTTKLFLDKGVI